MGQERTKPPTRKMSAFGGKADEIAGKADIKPAGLRFSRLFTDSHNGCMGWSEIVSRRFTGPVYQTRERFSAAMPQIFASERAFPTSSEPFADLASTHTCCRWPLLLQLLLLYGSKQHRRHAAGLSVAPYQSSPFAEDHERSSRAGELPPRHSSVERQEFCRRLLVSALSD